MKAVGFFYDWTGKRTLDPYFRQVAQAFGELGITLEVVLANEFRHPDGGQETIHPSFDQQKLARWVQEKSPDVIFSVNNAGLTEHLLAVTSAPVVTWLVDDLPHLFFHDGFGGFVDHFAGRERIFCYSSTLAEQVASAFPHARDRIAWMPHGTNLPGGTIARQPADIPIGFVGSCLPVDGLTRLLAVARRRGAATEVLAHLRAMRTDYVAGSAGITPSAMLMRSLAETGRTVLEYHRLLGEALTTQTRVEGLCAIADLGLQLWGNALWLDTLIGTPAIAEAFQFDTAITTPEELNGVYARSRISVNIPNVQNCSGLAVRVFDAMASPSLLITEYHPDSDLFRMFGADCPVPMYRSPAHLRELCAHYLTHEDERVKIVETCNRLIDERFALRHRIRAMLKAAGVAVPAVPPPAPTFVIAPAKRFLGLPREWRKIPHWTRFALGQLARRTLTSMDIRARALWS